MSTLITKDELKKIKTMKIVVGTHEWRHLSNRDVKSSFIQDGRIFCIVKNYNNEWESIDYLSGVTAVGYCKTKKICETWTKEAIDSANNSAMQLTGKPFDYSKFETVNTEFSLQELI